MRTTICPTCKGKRLKEKVLAVKINNKSIIDVTNLSVKEAIESLKFKFWKKRKINYKANSKRN
jgi:excinuclease ABC subunit A